MPLGGWTSRACASKCVRPTRHSPVRAPSLLEWLPQDMRSPCHGGILLTTYLLVSLGAGLIVAVLALCREVRLRRALEKLLSLILSRWRAYERNQQLQNLDDRR